MDRGLTDLKNSYWDIVIVGSGIGGAVAAKALAERGLKVLVLEKGEEASRSQRLPIWLDEINDINGGLSFSPFLGEGVGGSSALYGMVMESLEPTDFQSCGGLWPGHFEDWQSPFEESKKLFQCSRAKQLEAFEPLYKQMEKHGLKPKPLLLACQQRPDCEYCQSTICKKSCKVDADRGPLRKALETGNAYLQTGVEVISLNHQNGLVKSILCREKNETFRIQGAEFIVAAGALRTPLLIKRSKGTLTGSSSFADLPAVGRNLMRHLIDLYVLRWPEWKRLDFAAQAELSRAKVWGCDSLYKFEGTKLGTVQSFGSLPDFEYVWKDMNQQSKWIRLMPFLKPLARQAVKSIFQHPVAASIVEDSPSWENQVTEAQFGQLNIHYRISRADEAKVKRMRQKLQEAFGPYLYKFLPQANQNSRLAHVCGTCRMGEDEEKSVTDHYGKVHLTKNLWIADSSVFPASSGKNTSLVIAAHALRLAKSLLQANGERPTFQKISGSLAHRLD